MSRPPLKAVEQLMNYCEKHMCDECVFSHKVNNDNGFYINYKCYLNELSPEQWGQVQLKVNKKKVEQ